MRINQTSFPKLAAGLLLLVLAFILLNVVSGLNHNSVRSSSVSAKNGMFDLRTVDLSKQAPVNLIGEWAFDWNKLLAPSASFDSVPSTFVKVPHEWYADKVDSQAHSQYGYASYRLQVKVDKVYTQLALKVPNIGTAYKLYVDDTLIAQGGTVSDSQTRGRASYAPGIFLFEPNNDNFMLTLQVSNYDFLWAGMWKELQIGTPERVHTDNAQKLIRAAVLVCFFITVALFNIIQYLLRTIDPSPIVIASICVILGLREIEVSNILYFAQLAEMSFESSVKLNFLTFMGATPIIVGYFHLNFRDLYHAFIIKSVYLISILLVVLIVVAPPSVFSVIMPYYQLFIIVLSTYILWGLVRGLIAGKPNAKVLFLGTSILFVMVINDILSSLKLIDTATMAGYGLAAFIMCQTYITYLRFVNESSEKLMLEELAAKDPLTGLPNRRGIRVFMKNALYDFHNKQIPFCLMLIDFDHFKVINDSLGHDIGDNVLIEGARVMQDTVRERDVVSRWGGEEFLLLTPQCSLSGALNVAEKIKESVHSALSKISGTEITVTIGVAQIAPGESLDACIKRADVALYDGKRTGRNKVMIALD